MTSACSSRVSLRSPSRASEVSTNQGSSAMRAVFTLAVYALPFFAGMTAGLAAFHSGSGVLGALMSVSSPAARPW